MCFQFFSSGLEETEDLKISSLQSDFCSLTSHSHVSAYSYGNVFFGSLANFVQHIIISFETKLELVDHYSTSQGHSVNPLRVFLFKILMSHNIQQATQQSNQQKYFQVHLNPSTAQLLLDYSFACFLLKYEGQIYDVSLMSAFLHISQILLIRILIENPFKLNPSGLHNHWTKVGTETKSTQL